MGNIISEEKRIERNKYSREYRQKNLDEMRAKDKERYWKHREERKKYMLEWYHGHEKKKRIITKNKSISSELWRKTKSPRARILEYYGKICVRCGFSDERALQIDHVNGGGVSHRKPIGQHTMYSQMWRDILEGNSDWYQILCANCNWIKRYENKEDERKIKYHE